MRKQRVSMTGAMMMSAWAKWRELVFKSLGQNTYLHEGRGFEA